MDNYPVRGHEKIIPTLPVFVNGLKSGKFRHRENPGRFMAKRKAIQG
jgi:hypothetical protein